MCKLIKDFTNINLGKVVNSIPNMTLSEWLKKTNVTVVTFAKILEVDRCYIYQIMTGDRYPSDKIRQKIKELTFGSVEIDKVK